MEAKVKHLVSLAIKKMKSVGVIGKKKRKRRKAKALQEQVARENYRGTSEHMVGYSKPSASSQFSNSNNIAIDTQHRVNQAIRDKEEAERQLKANEPTLQQKLEDDIRGSILHSEDNMNDRLNSMNDRIAKSSRIDDTAPTSFNPAPDASDSFIKQTPTRHIQLVQEVGTPAQPPLTLGDFKLADLYALQNSVKGTKGSTSKAATFTDDDADNYIRNQAESLDEKTSEPEPEPESKTSEPPATPVKEVKKGGKREIGNNEARDLRKAEAVSLYGELPTYPVNIRDTTKKSTIDNWMEEQKRIREKAANKATYEKFINKKK